MRDDQCRTDLERLAGLGGVAGRWEEKPIFEIGQNGCNFLYQNINGKLIFDVCVVRGPKQVKVAILLIIINIMNIINNK